MSLRLYDTATRTVRDFAPLRPGRVGAYLCGATVQAPPHVGHVRGSLVFDVLRRWLERSGHEVVLIRNVTDVDDKIIQRGADEGVPPWRVAARNERAFSRAYDALGCLPPTYEPRATGHVPEMVALVERLLARGAAYVTGGDVWFDVRSHAGYGALSGQRLDELQPAPDAGAGGKRDPRDFALWKAAKPGEPSWPTPWGPGRPGWHLECSAMAERYLGAEFDIHGGGLDLVFPHHENELAQSRAAGDPFARYWLHNAWVTTAGEKMSKSLGNSLLVESVLERVRAVELRYYLVSAHYRSNLEYAEEALREAGAAYGRIEGFVRRAAERVGPGGDAADGALCAAFSEAMDDDLGVPAALAAVHDVVREGNTLLAGGGSDAALRGVLGSVRAMTGVLGLDPLAPQWAAQGDARLRGVVDALVGVALEQRAAARDRKDYAAADAVRDRLTAAGVAVEDTPTGPRWELRDATTGGEGSA